MDVSIIRMVVIALGIIACLCVGGMVILAHHNQDTPQALSLIATGAVTALVGILASPRSTEPGIRGDRGERGERGDRGDRG